MRFGIEAEYLLENGWDIGRVMALGISGVKKEFLRCMVELVSDTHDNPEDAVAEIGRLRLALENRGVTLSARASLSEYREITRADITGAGGYYEWVFESACKMLGCRPFDLHYAGIHINVSDSAMSEDEAVHAANWVRCLNVLFLLLTANSSAEDFGGAPAHSVRMLSYPNRWDVPFWSGSTDFRQWLAEQIGQGRVYLGKDRCWMTAIPRLNGGSGPYVEARGLDSGTAVSMEVIKGCCELAARIVSHAREDRRLPVSDPFVLRDNDRAVARGGFTATVMFRGEYVPILILAREWCRGIQPLEQRIEGLAGA